MKKAKVGLLTIGQSPREDLTSEIKPIFLPHIEIVEYGLLDGRYPEEMNHLKPLPMESPLVSRLRDGSQVQLSEKEISRLLPQALSTMKNKMDIQAAALLCTHNFPRIKYSFPVIFPFSYLQFLINEVLESERLGVVVPLENQVAVTREKWKTKRMVIQSKSPYTQGKSWRKIAQTLAQEKVDVVVLDCIGYTVKDKKELQGLLSVPVLLPRTILAFALNQLF